MESADYNPALHYIDFRKEPEHISDSLEDFQPWKEHTAIRAFVSLLRWLNSAESHFETNDCAFSVRANTDNSRPFVLQASGRVMLFVSEMALTCSPGSIDWLMQSFGVLLSESEPLDNAVVGIAKARCFFKAVSTTSYELV